MQAWTHLPEYLRTLTANSHNAVLLETSRFNSDNIHSYLFLDPVATIRAASLDEIPALFERMEAELAKGRHLAGYIGYECGEHFAFPRGQSRRHQKSSHGPLPLAWFGVYEEPFVFDHIAGSFAGAIPSEALIEPAPLTAVEDVSVDLRLNISESDYSDAIVRIQQYIAAGDTYQVNFTDNLTVHLSHSPAASFSALTAAQPVSYGALLSVGRTHILSLSPELFFRVEASVGEQKEGRSIVTRPMKGTMPRGLDLAEDTAQAVLLAADEKNRSEHVMIVDLLRNDLGRICRMGSVRAEELFSVERYRTLLQMTSKVSGELRSGLNWYEVFSALFPSGSITGAPKIRTMEIIRELERGPRGVYTGAIGHIAPSGAATFSVAIRTLVVEDGVARMGVGGGIVADSEPAAEYRECQLKARFIATPRREFQLIETMLSENDAVLLLPLHLDRLAASAEYFDFAFDRGAVEAQISAFLDHLPRGGRFRVRLLHAASGSTTLSQAPLADCPVEIVAMLSSHRTDSGDVFLRHKTTRRALYESEFARAHSQGYDEVLFLNERGELTEGAISNLFLRRNGKLLTPPLSSGILPGVLRRHILATDPTAEEKVLSLEDLYSAEAVFLGNSVRGLRKLARIEMGDIRHLSASLDESSV